MRPQTELFIYNCYKLIYHCRLLILSDTMTIVVKYELLKGAELNELFKAIKEFLPNFKIASRESRKFKL